MNDPCEQAEKCQATASGPLKAFVALFVALLVANMVVFLANQLFELARNLGMSQ